MGNIFMTPIYNKKKKFSLKQWWTHRKLMKTLKNSSPDFGTLWQIAEFIKTIENIFMYDNKVGSLLYSSKKYEFGSNGFVVTIENICKVTVKLSSDDEKVILEITRLSGEKMSNTLAFIKNQWDMDPDRYDEILLESATNIIMDAVSKVFNYYYNHKYDFYKNINKENNIHYLKYI